MRIINDRYDLNSPFDIDQHKLHYIHYFETILKPDGTVVYAVPSHQEKLIEIAQKKFHWTREDVMNKCPEYMRADFSKWLCDITGCIALWEHYILCPNKLTDKQINKLQELKDAQLYIPFNNI